MTDDTSGRVRLETDGPLARIVLDRPHKRNALNTHMLTELDDRLATVADSAEVRVVVVQAEGSVFCAGADTAEFAGLASETIRGRWTRLGQRVFGALADLPQTTVAALHGSAFGGGLELALHCDFRVAAPQIGLGLPEATLGTTPGWSGVSRVLGIAGPAAARMLALTGRTFSAQDALRLGIVDVIALTAESGVQQLVDDLLHTTPIAQSILKQALAHHSAPAVAGLLDSLAGAYLAEAGETIPTTTFRRSHS
ncbi:enoyl-CoA hydratase/isomerase family protein [Mycolicibacterium komossense]|uniref:Enoyl-CoA hydratase/isomerase family protein n=2 Tax=Mycolicibacterium komossense TaxID=1779 RepID=A0ABT3CHX3_9MYCO|nr:enoyl-CoA hydratase/isomerase family protein [Mycolicibacterium komossense]